LKTEIVQMTSNIFNGGKPKEQTYKVGNLKPTTGFIRLTRFSIYSESQKILRQNLLCLQYFVSLK
jgi:hypothetical protein